MPIVVGALLGAPSLAQEQSLFERLDKNGDSRVTLDEVGDDHQALFARMLRTSDRNDDGALTREEFAESLAPPAQVDQDRPSVPSPQQRGMMLQNAEQLFARLDRNGDDKLQPAELPERLSSRLADIDANRDGAVDRGEWSRIAPRLAADLPAIAPPPGGRLLQVLDRDRDGELSDAEMENAPALLKELDQDGDGNLSRREYGFAPISMPAASRPASGRPGDARRQFIELFQRMDRDGDQKISREEAPQNLRRNFDSADADRDGALDASELGRLLLRAGGRTSEDGASRDDLRRRINMLREQLDRRDNE